jgi:hypothetical protein
MLFKPGEFAGANIDYAASRKTYDNVSGYANKYPLVYLPSHDENSARRLVGKECLFSGCSMLNTFLMHAGV